MLCWRGCYDIDQTTTLSRVLVELAHTHKEDCSVRVMSCRVYHTGEHPWQTSEADSDAVIATSAAGSPNPVLCCAPSACILQWKRLGLKTGSQQLYSGGSVTGQHAWKRCSARHAARRGLDTQPRHLSMYLQPPVSGSNILLLHGQLLTFFGP